MNFGLTKEWKLIPFWPVPIHTCPALSSIKSVILLSAIDLESIGSCSKWLNTVSGTSEYGFAEKDRQLIPE